MSANLAGLLLVLLVAVVLVLGHISDRNWQNRLDNWKPPQGWPKYPPKGDK